ncbi:hypothetical protein ACQPZJ_44755 [Actinoplanes sp. CA-054009]
MTDSAMEQRETAGLDLGTSAARPARLAARRPAVTGTDPVVAERVVLVCPNCRVGLVLSIDRSRTGGEVIAPLRWSGPGHRESAWALWRFLSDHFGEPIVAVLEGAHTFADGTAIPDDLLLIEPGIVNDALRAPDDCTISDYLQGWPHLPALARVVGPRRYATLHPQPTPAPGRGRPGRATVRPGRPGTAHGDRIVHVPAGHRPSWLTHLLTHDSGWTLTTLSSGRATGSDDPIDAADVGTAHQRARQLLDADADKWRRGVVTEWRPVIVADRPGWVPLFTTSPRPDLPWPDLDPGTGAGDPVLSVPGGPGR